MGQSHGGAARKRRISLTSNESELSTSKDRGWGYVFFFSAFFACKRGFEFGGEFYPSNMNSKAYKTRRFHNTHTRLCFFFLLNFFTDRFSKIPIQHASSMFPRLSQNRSRPDLEKRLQSMVRWRPLFFM